MEEHILLKLPRKMRYDWAREAIDYKNEHDVYPPFSEIRKFIEKEADIAEIFQSFTPENKQNSTTLNKKEAKVRNINQSLGPQSQSTSNHSQYTSPRSQSTSSQSVYQQSKSVYQQS